MILKQIQIHLGKAQVHKSIKSMGDKTVPSGVNRRLIGVIFALQAPSKALSSILGKSNLQFAGMNITLNISTTSLNLMTPDSKQVSMFLFLPIIANHHMQSISFASGVDVDTTDYVAYVAKDPVNRRGYREKKVYSSRIDFSKDILLNVFLLSQLACHILECCDGLAQDIISTIGQAFELRFKQYLQCPSKIPALHDR
ncbi:hypothetical protein JD844_009036 [Phrynosoma platyrhinos]|uniref:PID domain-containing protein n=1 Tax=Phrynosoma platyrhinos TaxID=52577 RepID=A0ABQ7TEX8_PHRPL|nr:hypothetical protein JD844_009036 [Phrynosoma platyrhinos]